jgi:hypothetical protein
MRLKLPVWNVEVLVPMWCVALAILWPVVFFSFLLHSLAIGGDALNGKLENGHYFLWRVSRPEGAAARYLEVSKSRYTANYIHAVATMLLMVPAGIAIWRIVWPAAKQMQVARGPNQMNNASGSSVT